MREHVTFYIAGDIYRAFIKGIVISIWHPDNFSQRSMRQENMRSSPRKSVLKVLSTMVSQDNKSISLHEDNILGS
ncbi:7815_t:CDS:2 [Dentiscutata erythropus]|uniref:7815_t:CDS:1 n=1 Tax=Dentiscutata erythropus TaxID=1348616 RepID=A0A9N9CC12_9GLOM|nr:7815_t:CDS:2 [Dentiscutata erythropus]